MGGPALSTTDERPAGPPYLLDTHIWLWYLVGSERVPDTIRTEIELAVGQSWVSPISVWELGMLHARGRIDLRGGLRTWLDAAMRAFPVQEASLTREVALRSHEIDLGHRDPADHLLAATALVHGLTLLTLDERMAAASWLPTRSA